MQLIMNCPKCWSVLFKLLGVSLSMTNLELVEPNIILLFLIYNSWMIVVNAYIYNIYMINDKLFKVLVSLIQVGWGQP